MGYGVEHAALLFELHRSTAARGGRSEHWHARGGRPGASWDSHQHAGDYKRDHQGPKKIIQQQI
jgi:hypothetical protein